MSLALKSHRLKNHATSLHRFLSSSSSSPSSIRRIGIGTNKLSLPNTPDGTFPSVIATSIQNSITTFETTLHKEEEMRRGITDAIMFLQSQNKVIPPVDVIGKISYRTGVEEIKGDVLQETNDGINVYHNQSPEFIQQTMETSPLVDLKRSIQEVNLTYCLHNPEAQSKILLEKDAPLDEIRGQLNETLTNAFTQLETLVQEDVIDGYGVCSNGLSLQSSHPMHLSWEDVLLASKNASESLGVENHLQVMQLPINLLETYGLKVANRIKQENQNVKIHATRPLTCFPSRTGEGYPFKIVDYLLQDGFQQQWTHKMNGIPSTYASVLNETMGYFDAEHLLEIKEEGEQPLTTEERETLDGCKLLQSMIHDLDANLSSGQYRSYPAYEEDLYTKVVPLIHDTFEELDGDSAELLQRFFEAHGTAVRYKIANITRELLKKGGDNGSGEKYDVPDDQTLQEYAIQYLLQQKVDGGLLNGEPLLDRVIVGCPKAEHVIEVVHACEATG
ncbi:hypothetical protein CTEN210_15700 [Chaetoceros tenuissimus]|uniref:Uncharacterized protein n=1 Tax=Chaetoceros tenuissimus TaxID=426638 RepID=A0AAD3HDH7_9STRA|nr:hypothetical protein CTEN210_15700 [Chaetoceros tenuissimus]